MSWALCLLVMVPAKADSEVDFNRDIRPLLSKHCLACHGPDEETREAGLRLDSASGASADLGGYRAVEPGQPDRSELIARIESDDPDSLMPPPESGHSLSDEDKRLLRAWIAAGAEYKVHWAFVPPQRNTPPQVHNTGWSLSPIDDFVLQQLEANGLSPSPPLDRLRWIRRVSLDLTGLPPTPVEADAFLADTGEDAYTHVVDSLLASDAFGEHWTRMWLDLARYADTKGYEKDLPRQMWRYRDWVIDAFNDDMPYDQFTIEQLAGDLQPNASQSQRLATGFHRNTMTNDEGGTDNEEFRVAAVKDRVDTTFQVWMGLTMGCAKCHSHKYDPISQADYYAAFAFFNQTEDADRSDDAPLLPSPTEAQSNELAGLASEIEAIEQRLKERPDGYEKAYASWRQSLGDAPIWQALTMTDFSSQHDVQLTQREDATLVASGERPSKDTWTVTFKLPESVSLTSLRLDVFSQAQAGGEWPDANVALREMTVEHISAGKDAVPLSAGKDAVPLGLKAARADFSQANWDVQKAFDGDASVGWAISPQIGKPHVAVFDLEAPLATTATSLLCLTLDQQYGMSLLLPRFRVSVSSHPTEILNADLDVEAGLRDLFARRDFKPTRKQYETLAELQSQQDAIRRAVASTPVMKELAGDRQRETHIHVRGNFLSPGDSVQPAVPEVFGGFPDEAPLNRLGVAAWLTQPTNPLTARVMVNRVWARLFGIGLVETEEDFGTQGMLPSHPELLDWLAVEFRQQGWSLKRLIREIVLSATYRQSSVVPPEHLNVDPQNRLIGHFPRVRLSAEMVRDQALQACGLLTHPIGGESVMPPQPPGVWKTTYSALTWQNDVGRDRYRRALYTFWKRTSPYPANLTFDAGSGEVCLIRRIRTNTPLQALVGLNDTVYLEAAGALAQRMQASAGSISDKITVGFRQILIRVPDDEETQRLVDLYQTLESDFGQDPDAVAALLKQAGFREPGTASDAAMVSVANVLLNLDETLMRP